VVPNVLLEAIDGIIIARFLNKKKQKNVENVEKTWQE